MLNSTFKMFILYYGIMLVICALLVLTCAVTKGALKVVGCARLITRVPYGFVIRRKYFVGNLSTNL